MRSGNLARLDVERHFKWHGQGNAQTISLAIPASEVKNGQPIEADFSRDTTRLIRTYLKFYRHLVSDDPGDWLFPCRYGGPRSDHLAEDMCKVIYRETGLVMNAHLFRHFAGMLYLQQRPGAYEAVRRILGHRKLGHDDFLLYGPGKQVGHPPLRRGGAVEAGKIMTNSPTDLPLILKRPNWPITDQIAWDALFTEGDILDGSGPCVRWSEGSRRKREQTYGHWLGFLSGRGPLGVPSDVTDRATLETVVAFIEKELARCSVRTVYMHVEDLMFLLRAMAPGKDWVWLDGIVWRLRARSNLGELKPRAGVTAPQIYEWALTRMRQADAMDSITDLRRATLYRDGLMVGLLIARPLRLRTFIAIELDRHLVARGDGFLLRFAPEDMKDKKAHEYAVPLELVEPLRRYLGFHRPNLLQKKSSQRLWITRSR